jgi:hypothetical protein
MSGGRSKQYRLAREPEKKSKGLDINDSRASCELRGESCRGKLPGNGDSDPTFAAGNSRFARPSACKEFKLFRRFGAKRDKKIPDYA